MDTPEPQPTKPEEKRLETLLAELSSLIAYAEEQGFKTACDLLKEEHEKVKQAYFCVMRYGYSRWPTTKV